MPALDELSLCPDEEELFEAISRNDTPEMAAMRQEAEAFIRQFCDIYKVRHSSTGYTTEAGFYEPMYYFTDNLGGYTLAGIRNSLKD